MRKWTYLTVLKGARDFYLTVMNAMEFYASHTEEGTGILRIAHGLTDHAQPWADKLNSQLVETCYQIVAKWIGSLFLDIYNCTQLKRRWKREERLFELGLGTPMEIDTMTASSEVDELSKLWGSVMHELPVAELVRLHTRRELLLYNRRRSQDRAQLVQYLAVLLESRENSAIMKM